MPADLAGSMGIIDTDIHTNALPTDPAVLEHLPTRWVEYLQMLGLRRAVGGSERPLQRQFAHRTDSVPDSTGVPGTDPDFARLQLLDEYGLCAGIINDNAAFFAPGIGAHPLELDIALARAYNEYRRATWLASDPRWYTSVSIPFEAPEAAAREIRRCKEETGADGARFVQALMPPNTQRPAGNQFYWPILEACEHYGIPIAFHVPGSTKATACGDPNFYFEEHSNFALLNFPLVSSLLFEGVFDRFPRLKVGLIELGWSWAAPLAWRADRVYGQLRDEVSHLTRRPSEYFTEHFYFSTQPLEEPENLAWFEELFAMFENAGFRDRLMYSSDYPHWDFDPPTVLPSTLSELCRRRILGETASELYGIPLTPADEIIGDRSGVVPAVAW
jgi:predicted TIM-barrel fold metal-dependent hydrolase